jgi:nitrate reductase NapA
VKKKKGWSPSRRDFLKVAGAAGVTSSLAGCGQVHIEKGGELARAAEEQKKMPGRQEFPSQCPYCGVGCATLIQTEGDKIVGMVPDKGSPVNVGVQCIKGLTAWEPTYVDRLTACLIRKDQSDPLKGHVSATKGRLDADVWREVSYKEASEFVAERTAAIAKASGGNSVGLYGSGQLTVEGQYLENKFIKGVLASNTIEANARMCMTSAVTGYIHSLGSDTPPGCYEDIELCDFISFWGHNCRESHPVIFWRAADHKKKNGIATLVVDPRRTATVQGFEAINPENSYHAPIINADVALLNSIGNVLLNDHKDVIAWDFMKKHTDGWKEYVDGLADYTPEKVQIMTGLEPSFIRKVAGEWAAATRKGNKRGRGGVVTFWGIGYNQSIHGQHNTISIVNLHLLTGNIGRPGACPFSQTGQPNAMGERLTGGLTGRLPFNEGLGNKKHRDHIAKHWSIPPERLDQVAKEKNPGMAIGLYERALKGDVKALFIIYCTHIDLPETKTLVRPAMEKMFVVAQEIYAHAPNLLYADVVFPAATWGEWKGGTYINSERRFYVTDGLSKAPYMTINGKIMKDDSGKPMMCKPDLDIVIDKGREIAHLLGLDAEKMFPYKVNPETGWVDPEDIYREFLAASKGTDADLSGMLEVEKLTGKSPYQQIRDLKGIQWPAPTAELAMKGGVKRRYMWQEKGWDDKPYGAFRRADGKAKFKLCQQTYEDREKYIAKVRPAGVDPNWYAIDHLDDLITLRDRGLCPELPDFEFQGKVASLVPEGKYPFWLLLGVVYEHFHTAKTIRGATTRRLVPEQYLEMHPEDAANYGIQDGDMVRISTRRGSYEARASVGGTRSKVRPARNEVQAGMIFSPWNLSVADAVEPEKNKWLVNQVSHRAFDPVSGQADFKKLAARIEKIV